MDVQALSEMALVLGAFLGALAVGLAGLRIQVKRDTEAWARSYWEAGTRTLVEIEAKVASGALSLDDDPAPLLDEPGAEVDPNEDPAARRQRERKERAARIRERIAQKRIADRVMDEAPEDVSANYVGPAAFGGDAAAGVSAARRPPARGRGGYGAYASSPVTPTEEDENAIFGDIGLDDADPATAGPPTAGPATAGPTPTAAPEPAMPRAPRPAPRPPEPAPRPEPVAAPRPEPAPDPRPEPTRAPRPAPPRPAAPSPAAPSGFTPAPPPPQVAPPPAAPSPPIPQFVAPPSPEPAQPGVRYKPGVPVPSDRPVPSVPAPPPPQPPPPPPQGPSVGENTDLRDIASPARTSKGKAKPQGVPDPSRLPPELIAQIKELDAAGRRISAFKLYREYTGVGFRDAEDQVKKILESA